MAKEHPHGGPPGQQKKQGGGGEETGGGTAIVTTSTLAFELAPNQVTVAGNTCTVSGLETGREYDASTQFSADEGTDLNTGATVNEKAGEPGTYYWDFKLQGAQGAGDCSTWLRAKGGTFFDPPLDGPDGNPLKWGFRYDGE